MNDFEIKIERIRSEFTSEIAHVRTEIYKTKTNLMMWIVTGLVLVSDVIEGLIQHFFK